VQNGGLLVITYKVQMCVCILLYMNVVKGTILYPHKYDIKSLTC